MRSSPSGRSSAVVRLKKPSCRRRCRPVRGRRRACRCRRCPRCSPRRRSRPRTSRRGRDRRRSRRRCEPACRCSRRACATRSRGRVTSASSTIRANASSIPPSPWIVSLPSWPKSRSLLGAARDVVVAEAAARRGSPRSDVEIVEVVRRVAVREVDGVLGPPREGVDARAVRIAEVLRRRPVDQEPAARVGAVVRRTAAAGVRAVGAAVEQRAAERLEAAARDVARGRDVGLDGLDDAAHEEDLVAEDRSSCSSPSSMSLPAPPTMTSRPRLPKTTSSLPFWNARDSIRRTEASSVVWIFWRRASGRFGSVTCWMTAPWSPKMMSS